MKKQTMTALLGIAIAGIAGILSVSAFSATSLLVAPTVSSADDGITLTGHVTAIVRDADGNIKAYMQTDNLITDVGEGCMLVAIFDTDATAPCTLTAGTGFNYVAIGNSTDLVVAETNTAIDTSAGNGIEMARNQDTTPTLEAGTQSVRTATISPAAFTFTDLSGTTTVTESALFDAASGGNMLADQSISVSVGSSDSLTVTWTIDVTA